MWWMKALLCESVCETVIGSLQLQGRNDLAWHWLLISWYDLEHVKNPQYGHVNKVKNLIVIGGRLQGLVSVLSSDSASCGDAVTESRGLTFLSASFSLSEVPAPPTSAPPPSTTPSPSPTPPLSIQPVPPPSLPSAPPPSTTCYINNA